MNRINAKFFINEINNPFVRYNVLQGTKYRLNRCGLLVGTTGALAGASVYAIADKPVKKYLIPSAVVVGSASMLLLLTRNNYSLKSKIVSRGVGHVKDVISTQIKEEFNNRNELYKLANRFLERKDKNKMLFCIINDLDDIIEDSNTAALKNKYFLTNLQKFHDNNRLVRLSMHLYFFVNNIINNKIATENIVEEDQQELNAKDACNIKLNYYQELLIDTRIFMYLYTNKIFIDKYIFTMFYKNLKGTMSKNELCYIKYMASRTIILNNLQSEGNRCGILDSLDIKIIKYIFQKSLETQLNIKKILFKYNLKINDDGTIEFLKQNKLENHLPK